jgi:hypothetical protein
MIRETKLGRSISDQELRLNDFVIFRRDRNRNGGGVATYVNHAYMPRISDVTIPGLEALAVDLTFNRTHYTVVNVYCPPSCATATAHTEFLDQLSNFLGFVGPRTRHYCGGFQL